MSIPPTYALRPLIGLAALLVAGCGVVRVMTPDPKLASEGAEQKTTSSSPAGYERAVLAPPPSDAPPTPSKPIRKPEPKPEAKLAAAAPLPEPETRAAAVPMPDPDKLLGMGEADIMQWLGSPVSRRDEPPANVWRYATESCALEVAFFLDVDNDTRRVLSYDFEVEKDGSEDALVCFKDIEQKHAAALQDPGPR